MEKLCCDKALPQIPLYTGTPGLLSAFELEVHLAFELTFSTPVFQPQCLDQSLDRSGEWHHLGFKPGIIYSGSPSCSNPSLSRLGATFFSLCAHS